MEEKFTLAKWSNYTKNNKVPRSISQVNQQKNNEKKDFKNNKNDSVHKDPMNKNQTQVNQKESKTNLIRTTNSSIEKIKSNPINNDLKSREEVSIKENKNLSQKSNLKKELTSKLAFPIESNKNKQELTQFLSRIASSKSNLNESFNMDSGRKNCSEHPKLKKQTSIYSNESDFKEDVVMISKENQILSRVCTNTTKATNKNSREHLDSSSHGSSHKQEFQKSLSQQKIPIENDKNFNCIKDNYKERFFHIIETHKNSEPSNSKKGQYQVKHIKSNNTSQSSSKIIKNTVIPEVEEPVNSNYLTKIRFTEEIDDPNKKNTDRGIKLISIIDNNESNLIYNNIKTGDSKANTPNIQEICQLSRKRDIIDKSPPKNNMNKVLSRILILQNKENSLTKLPFKKQPKTKVDKKEYEQAERAAVLIRRMQYSKIIKDQQKVKLQSAEDLYNMLLFEAKVIRIQRCWRIVLNNPHRNYSASLIQKLFRGYYSRKALIRSIIKSYNKSIMTEKFIKLKKNIEVIRVNNQIKRILNNLLTIKKKYGLKKHFFHLKTDYIYSNNKHFTFIHIKLIQKFVRGYLIRTLYKSRPNWRFIQNINPLLKILLKYKISNKYFQIKYLLYKFKSKIVKKRDLIKKIGKFLKLAKILKNYTYRKHFKALNMKSNNKNVIESKFLLRQLFQKILAKYSSNDKQIYFGRWKRLLKKTKAILYIIKILFIQIVKRICFNNVFKKLNNFKISGDILDNTIINRNRSFIEFYYKFKNFTKIFVLKSLSDNLFAKFRKRKLMLKVINYYLKKYSYERISRNFQRLAFQTKIAKMNIMQKLRKFIDLYQRHDKRILKFFKKLYRNSLNKNNNTHSFTINKNAICFLNKKLDYLFENAKWKFYKHFFKIIMAKFKISLIIKEVFSPNYKLKLYYNKLIERLRDKITKSELVIKKIKKYIAIYSFSRDKQTLVKYFYILRTNLLKKETLLTKIKSKVKKFLESRCTITKCFYKLKDLIKKRKYVKLIVINRIRQIYTCYINKIREGFTKFQLNIKANSLNSLCLISNPCDLLREKNLNYFVENYVKLNFDSNEYERFKKQLRLKHALKNVTKSYEITDKLKLYFDKFILIIKLRAELLMKIKRRFKEMIIMISPENKRFKLVKYFYILRQQLIKKDNLLKTVREKIKLFIKGREVPTIKKYFEMFKSNCQKFKNICLILKAKIKDIYLFHQNSLKQNFYKLRYLGRNSNLKNNNIIQFIACLNYASTSKVKKTVLNYLKVKQLIHITFNHILTTNFKKRQYFNKFLFMLKEKVNLSLNVKNRIETFVKKYALPNNKLTLCKYFWLLNRQLLKKEKNRITIKIKLLKFLIKNDLLNVFNCFRKLKENKNLIKYRLNSIKSIFKARIAFIGTLKKIKFTQFKQNLLILQKGFSMDLVQILFFNKIKKYNSGLELLINIINLRQKKVLESIFLKLNIRSRLKLILKDISSNLLIKYVDIWKGKINSNQISNNCRIGSKQINLLNRPVYNGNLILFINFMKRIINPKFSCLISMSFNLIANSNSLHRKICNKLKSYLSKLEKKKGQSTYAFIYWKKCDETIKLLENTTKSWNANVTFQISERTSHQEMPINLSQNVRHNIILFNSKLQKYENIREVMRRLKIKNKVYLNTLITIQKFIKKLLRQNQLKKFRTVLKKYILIEPFKQSFKNFVKQLKLLCIVKRIKKIQIFFKFRRLKREMIKNKNTLINLELSKNYVGNLVGFIAKKLEKESSIIQFFPHEKFISAISLLQIQFSLFKKMYFSQMKLFMFKNISEKKLFDSLLPRENNLQYIKSIIKIQSKFRKLYRKVKRKIIIKDIYLKYSKVPLTLRSEFYRLRQLAMKWKENSIQLKSIILNLKYKNSINNIIESLLVKNK